jgi:hypothetical protein
MEWLLRYCRARSLMEEPAMMTLMPEEDYFFDYLRIGVCMSALCHRLLGKTIKSGERKKERK